MTVAVITRSAPRTELVAGSASCLPVLRELPKSAAKGVAGHAYCLPVVRELPVPVADPAGDRSW
jgi:hypothetical protein